MSVIRACIVRCDHRDCPNELVSRGSELPIVGRTDSSASGWAVVSVLDRWSRYDVTDFCPDHVGVK